MKNLDTHQLVHEWDYLENGTLQPSEVSLGSGKKVAWVCAAGHKWRSIVGNRVRLGAGCPYCIGKRAVQGVNDVLTLHPHLKKQCEEPDKLFEVPAGSKKKVRWKCPEEHVWEASVEGRTTKKSGCPYCSGRIPIQGVNDLATTHPEMVREWDWDTNALTPQEVSAGSNKKVGWVCSSNHQWSVSPNSRNNSKSGCPHCSGTRVSVGESDLSTTNPDLIDEWDWCGNVGISPSEVSSGSSRKVMWVCSVDPSHQWCASISKRARSNQGCPLCSGRRVVQGETDLATTHPSLLDEWDWDKNVLRGLNPNEISAGSGKVVNWKCRSGHEWEAVVASRGTGGPRGCPWCVGWDGQPRTKHTLIAEDAALMNEWDVETNRNLGLDPSEITCGSSKRVWWKCLTKPEHRWSTPAYSRRSTENYESSGCPSCTLHYSKIEEEIRIRLTREGLYIPSRGTLNIPWGSSKVSAPDILIPNSMLIVEYDGSYWHKDKINKDIQKTKALIAAGFTVLRIRERPLEWLPDSEGLHQWSHDHLAGNLDLLINRVLGLIG